MPPVISNSVILGLSQFAILQEWIKKLFKISLPGMGINTHLLPVVTFSLTPPKQVKLSPLYGRRGQKSYPFRAKIVTWGHFAPKDSFYVISLCAVEHFHQNGQLRGKVRREKRVTKGEVINLDHCSRRQSLAALHCSLALAFWDFSCTFLAPFLQSCCSWLVCKLSALTLRQSFLRRRIRNFVSRLWSR